MTLGCKVNQYESQAVERLLCERGYEIAVPGEGCDVCIINTCAVTAESERKSRQLIRRMKKSEPNALIAVCGCYSQLEPQAVAELGVDLLGGVGDRLGFAVDVNKIFERGKNVVRRTIPLTKNVVRRTVPLTMCEDLPPGNTQSRTRALLKIQDGCDNFCAYCIVPYIRGRSRSLPLEWVIEYARQLNEQGYKEIVVTGIEISSYGKERSLCLAGAIKAISNAAPDARIRIGSLVPSLLTDEFCRDMSEIPNLCNHFHLSLQSGCDGTLKRMGRKYTANEVLKSIGSIRKHFNKNGKDCGITADLIVGFPGETEDEFEKTLDMIRQAKFSDMHIFPYSVRPGTKAAGLPLQTDKNTKKERAKRAKEIADDMASEFKKSQIGKTLDVLFEQEKNGLGKGHSSNYLEVAVNEKAEQNSTKKVKITGFKNSILTGEIV